MTELGGPGASGDCSERNGMHFAEDHFLPEIINTETGEWVPEGEVGRACSYDTYEKGNAGFEIPDKGHNPPYI